MKYVMLLSLLWNFNVRADSSPDDLALADEAIQTPTLDIEGQYQVKEEPKSIVNEVREKKIELPKVTPKRLSQSERLKLYREKLEERNRIMVEKKMEQIRYQQEVALARRLEQSMNQTLKAIDSVKN